MASQKQMIRAIWPDPPQNDHLRDVTQLIHPWHGWKAKILPIASLFYVLTRSCMFRRSTAAYKKNVTCLLAPLPVHEGTINGKCVNRNTRPYFMHSSIPPPNDLNRSNRLPVL